MYTTINKEQYQAAVNYANNKSIVNYMGETTYNTRVREQSLTGKLGEWGVYNTLDKINYKITKPDCEIYIKPPTTPDLILDNKTGIEVKTTTLYRWNMYKQSWIIDNLGNSLVALCILENNKVHLKALLPAKIIKKLQKRAIFIDKPAIHYNDLPKQKYINDFIYQVDLYRCFKDL